MFKNRVQNIEELLSNISQAHEKERRTYIRNELKPTANFSIYIRVLAFLLLVVYPVGAFFIELPFNIDFYILYVVLFSLGFYIEKLLYTIASDSLLNHQNTDIVNLEALLEIEKKLIKLLEKESLNK